jgi:hypothetical protein
MKTKLPFLLLFIAIILIFMQQQRIDSLKTSIGSTYQIQIREVINATSNFEITGDHMIDDELFTSLTMYSLQLDRIPNADVKSVAASLSELAIAIKQPYIDLAAENNKISEIHKKLSTINEEIADDPKQWYKMLHE